MRWRWVAGGVVAIVVAVGAFNWFSAIAPLRSALSDDPRNEGLSIWAYHRLGVLPGELVFDVRGLAPRNSASDVVRVLLQYARAQKGSSFDHVTLAYRGEARFRIDGRYFSKLGAEYDYQNPLYTLRTMPENIYTPAGLRAYDSWTGGILGVTARQMEDLNDFTRDWFLRDEGLR
ncbi:hypothetical protein [Inquilinus sp. Marseille-Q2685]|uniref:hypothetical protein n=1 Tax=Inquilinus sp. Marseille-Q2685 TaxID=2866581 RepID=UPI001CE44B84|nr:hypothetical protein [Inquilinus sp. Marseille-Q2685]